MTQKSYDDISSIIKFVNEEASKLILVLEDMIETILGSNDVNSISMRGLKERTIDAKGHLRSLRDTLINGNTFLSEEKLNVCKKELDIYNDEYLDDVVTSWILNGSREIVMDKLYSACYRIRELMRKIQ